MDSFGKYVLIIEVDFGKYGSGNHRVMDLGTDDRDLAIDRATALLKGDPDSWYCQNGRFSTEGESMVLNEEDPPRHAWLAVDAYNVFDLDELRKEAEGIRDKMIKDSLKDQRRAEYEKLKQEFGP